MSWKISVEIFLPRDAKRLIRGAKSAARNAETKAKTLRSALDKEEAKNERLTTENKTMLSSYQEIGLFPTVNGTIFVDPRKWPGIEKVTLSEKVKLLPLDEQDQSIVIFPEQGKQTR